MAASFSRPDPSSPASVAEAGFSIGRRGYQPDEVRSFLVAVAAELGRLQERERLLESELRRERTLTRTSQELDEATVAELLGEETVRVLQTARESATLIRSRAEDAAARILGDAHDEANRLRQEADVESARLRNDAMADAEAEVELAKQQGREMVNEARAYRERVLADLERRTSLARQQIEDLLGGRDRLLQAFERARLVALDVTSSLQSVELPDETVNLTPTTGPVPMMVPADRRASPVVHPVSVEPAVEPAVELTESDTGTEVHEEPTDDIDAVDEVPVDIDVVDEVPVDIDVVDEVPVDEVPVDEVPVDEVPVMLGNVVPLFRGVEPSRLEADETLDAEHGAADPLEGLFARLRSELPIADASGVGSSVASVPEPESIDPVPVDGTVGDTPFERRDEVLVPLIVGAARTIKRVLADEQNGVLDTLRQRTPFTSIDQLLPGLDDHVASYTSAIDEQLAASMVAGSAEAGLEDGRALRARLAGAGAAESAIETLRSTLIVPLRDRIERAVFEGDGDNEVITQRVRSIYREWKTQHIDAEVDDIMRSAFCGGLASSLAVGTPVVWRLDPSVVACPECEDNSLSEPVPSGSMFPTGHLAPPAHLRCRCLVLPAD